MRLVIFRKSNKLILVENFKNLEAKHIKTILTKSVFFFNRYIEFTRHMVLDRFENFR